MNDIVSECYTCTDQVCCKCFKVPVTYEESLILRLSKWDWEHGRFAYLDKKEDGSCWYLEGGMCTIWETRPESCREYSCQGDKRIDNYRRVGKII